MPGEGAGAAEPPRRKKRAPKAKTPEEYDSGKDTEQSGGEVDINELLDRCRLTKFADALYDEGFDDVETLPLATDRDLGAVGMGRGHIIRLRRGLERAAEGAM